MISRQQWNLFAILPAATNCKIVSHSCCIIVNKTNAKALLKATVKHSVHLLVFINLKKENREKE